MTTKRDLFNSRADWQEAVKKLQKANQAWEAKHSHRWSSDPNWQTAYSDQELKDVREAREIEVATWFKMKQLEKEDK